MRNKLIKLMIMSNMVNREEFADKFTRNLDSNPEKDNMINSVIMEFIEKIKNGNIDILSNKESENTEKIAQKLDELTSEIKELNKNIRELIQK